MATLRTPSSIYHPDVSFLSDGELGSQDVLNRPLYSLNDNTEFLKNAQELDSARGQALAQVVGETYSSSITSTTWSSNTYFSAGATHHDAIEGLDAGLSALAVATDVTRINNLDNLILGENSLSGSAPDWSVTRSPFAFLNGDSHHAAIEKLDIQASAIDGVVVDHETRISIIESSLSSTLVDLASVQGTVGSQQTELDAVSVLVFSQGSQLSTLESTLVFSRSEVSTLEDSLEAVSTVVDATSCVMEKVKSQINVLRQQHSLSVISTWCP